MNWPSHGGVCFADDDVVITVSSSNSSSITTVEMQLFDEMPSLNVSTPNVCWTLDRTTDGLGRRPILLTPQLDCRRKHKRLSLSYSNADKPRRNCERRPKYRQYLPWSGHKLFPQKERVGLKYDGNWTANCVNTLYRKKQEKQLCLII